MSEYSIRTMLNDIDIDLPPKLSIKYPKRNGSLWMALDAGPDL